MSSLLIKGQQKSRVGGCNYPKMASGFMKDGLGDANLKAFWSIPRPKILISLIKRMFSYSQVQFTVKNFAK